MFPLIIILCGSLLVANLINQEIAESFLQHVLCLISGLLVGLILVLVFKIFVHIKNSQGN